jgi:hypothetical protein
MLCNIVMNNLTISLVVLHKTCDPKKFKQISVQFASGNFLQ